MCPGNASASLCSDKKSILLASCTTKNAFQDFSGMFPGFKLGHGSRSLETKQSGREPSSFNRSHAQVPQIVPHDQNDWHEPFAIIIAVIFHQQMEGKQVNESHGLPGGPQYHVYCPTSFRFATASFIVQKYGQHQSGNANGINAFQIGWKLLILVSSWEYCLLIRFLFKIPSISALRRFHRSRHSSRP